jgi:predicted enzyme related to lactoylglutathione lyase
MSDSTSSERPAYKGPAYNCVAFTRIAVQDKDRAQAFFEAVFGWNFMKAQPNFPRIFFTGGEVMGGLHQASSTAANEEQSGSVVNYILVEDVDATLTKVVEAGGKVHKAKFMEGDHSELAEFIDTEGNLHGLLHWVKQ